MRPAQGRRQPAAGRTGRYGRNVRLRPYAGVPRTREGRRGGKPGFPDPRHAAARPRRTGHVRPAGRADRRTRREGLPAPARSRRGRIRKHPRRGRACHRPLRRQRRHARRLRQGALRAAADRSQIRKLPQPARRHEDICPVRRYRAAPAVRSADGRRRGNARRHAALGFRARNRDQHPRLGIRPPRRIRRIRGGVRLLARTADSAAAAERRPQGQRQPALHRPAGDSRRNGPDARPGHEHDGQRLVPSYGHRTDERPGHGALPRGGRLLRLGLRSRQHRASPRGRRREPAHRRAGGPLVGTRRRGADRLLGRTPAA